MNSGSAMRLWRTLLGLSWRADRFRTVAVLIVAPVSGLTAGAVALGLKWLVDAVLAGVPADAVIATALLAVAAVAMTLLGTAAARLRLSLQHRVGHELDRRLIELCASPLDLRHHEDPEFQDRLETLRTNRSTITLAVTSLVENLRNATRLGSILALVATVDPVLLLLPVFALPALVAASAGRRTQEHADEATARPGRVREWLFTLATAPDAAREVRVGALADEFTARHDHLQRFVHRTRHVAITRIAFLDLLAWVVFCAGFLAALALLTAWVGQGRNTPGDLVLLVTAAAQVDTAVTFVAKAAHWLRQARWAGSHYLWLVDRVGQPSVQDTTVAATGDLVLDRVSFTYPGRDEPVLREVSLRLAPGTTVALVGTNGAGKSTLVKLLCGLYQPTGGTITVDGVDLREASWRGRVTAAFQDFCRFELPVRESVGLGDVARMAEPAAVDGALRRAGAAPMAAALPHGADTQLGRTYADGVELSAGQWQSLAVARALLADRPALVVLDEPAANLDPVAEHALFHAYATASQGHQDTITVLVSHRFSTVRDAELIMVLDGGRIAECGTHDELLVRGGQYAAMFERHREGYRLSGARRPTPG